MILGFTNTRPYTQQDSHLLTVISDLKEQNVIWWDKPKMETDMIALTHPYNFIYLFISFL